MNFNISANIMVKNEERCIKRCLDSIYNFVDEIIVVDTGSTDLTKQIIKQYDNKIKLYEKKWENNFSMIRNFMKSKSTCKIIFQIDADEYISDQEDIKKIKKKICDYFVIYKSLALKIKDHNGHLTYAKRLFFNSKDIEYIGLIHEELRYQSYPLIETKVINLTLFHDGYSPLVLNNKSKYNRNKILNEKMVIQDPLSSRWLYFLIRDLYVAGENFDKILKLIKDYFNNKYINRDKNHDLYIYFIKGALLSSSNPRETLKIVNLIKKKSNHSIDYIYLELLLIEKYSKNKKNDINKTLIKLIEFKTFTSVLNTTGDHIKIKLFWMLFSIFEYDKAFSILAEININFKKNYIYKELNYINLKINNELLNKN